MCHDCGSSGATCGVTGLAALSKEIFWKASALYEFVPVRYLLSFTGSAPVRGEAKTDSSVVECEKGASFIHSQLRTSI